MTRHEHGTSWPRAVALALAFSLLGMSGVIAEGVVQPVQFEDAEKEEQYQRLLRELRCTVCQSETIYESRAPLAADMRRRVYDMTKEGQSEEVIIDFMVQRYGDYVRYRPAMQSNTFLLWVSPFLALIVGGIIWVQLVRRRNSTEETSTELTEEQRKQLERLRRER